MNAICLDERIQAMGAEKRDGCRQTNHVLFFVVVQFLAVFGAYQPAQDDRRAAVYARVVTNLFEDRQNLNVLEKALRDLLALGIVQARSSKAENLSPRRAAETQD